MRRQAILVFLFFALFYTLTNSFRETVQIPDEEYVLDVTASIVNQTSLALPDHVPKYAGSVDIGKDGKAYSSFQIGQSLVYVPFYWVFSRVLAFSDPYDEREHGSRNRYNVWLERQTRSYLYLCPSLFTALSCAILFLFAVRLGFSASTSLLLTVLYGLGTMAWPYSKYLLTEASQNALLWGTVYLLYAQRAEGRAEKKAMAIAGTAFGLLLSIRVIFVILIPILAAYWFYRNRDRRLVAPILWFGVPLLLMAIPQLLYNQVRFGGALNLGYEGGSFSNPLFVGLFGYLVSPGKGFFFYNPILILALFGFRSFFRRAPSEAILVGLVAIVVPLKYATWWVWSGDPAWGPRFLLVLTPLLMLPVGELVERAIVARAYWKRVGIALLFSASASVQVLAVSAHYLHYYHYMRANGSLMEKARYLYAEKTGIKVPLRDSNLESAFIPEYSPILGQWWVVKSLTSGKQLTGNQAPWSGLGYTKLHEKTPLKATWDLWIVNAMFKKFHWANIRVLLGGLALLILLTMIGQELFSGVLGSRRKEPE